MSLDSEKVNALRKPLARSRVHQREGTGKKKFDYLASHDVIRCANAIFGEGEWGHEVVDLTLLGVEPVTSEFGKPGNRVGYRCTVRLTVNGCVPTSGVGYGDAVDYRDSLVTPHELAVKEAESDAVKRALKNFGDQFGLILYAKEGEERERIEHQALLRAKRAAGSGEPAAHPSAEEPQADVKAPAGHVSESDSRSEAPSSADLPFASSAGVVSQEPPSEARATPAENIAGIPIAIDENMEPGKFELRDGEKVVATGYMKTERGGGGTTRVGGVETYPGLTFKEWSKPWLIDEDTRNRIFDTRGFDHTVFEPWDRYRKDGDATKGLIREIDEKDVLILYADREARTRERKGVFEAIQKQLDKIGGGTKETVAPPLAGSEEPAPAAADPLPETLQAADPLLRMRAASVFITQQKPAGVAKPELWTEQKILAGMKQIGIGDFKTLDDASEQALLEVWGLVPQDVRLHIEGLDAATVARMAADTEVAE